MMRIACNQLIVRYGTFTALDQVSLEIPAGQYVALLGENGAGKSTLLRTLSGWNWANGGTVLLNDQPVTRNERENRRLIKLVPDTPQFYPDLTVTEHLQLVAAANHVAAWQPSAERLLRRFGIDHHAKAYPTNFSRGMQYKLAMTMALITEPQLLLLDEPFGPLDPDSQAYLAEHLSSIAETGVSIVLSTHVLPDERPPHRIVVLEQGRVVVDEPLETLWAQYGHVPLGTLPHRILSAALAASRTSDE